MWHELISKPSLQSICCSSGTSHLLCLWYVLPFSHKRQFSFPTLLLPMFLSSSFLRKKTGKGEFFRNVFFSLHQFETLGWWEQWSPAGSVAFLVDVWQMWHKVISKPSLQSICCSSGTSHLLCLWYVPPFSHKRQFSFQTWSMENETWEMKTWDRTRNRMV